MLRYVNSIKRALIGGLGALVLATTCLAAATVPGTATESARAA